MNITKKKRGRPRKPAHSRKSDHLHIRLNHSVTVRLDSAIQDLGITKTVFVELAILDKLDKCHADKAKSLILKE